MDNPRLSYKEVAEKFNVTVDTLYNTMRRKHPNFKKPYPRVGKKEPSMELQIRNARIRMRYEAGESDEELALAFNLHIRTIGKITKDIRKPRTYKTSEKERARIHVYQAAAEKKPPKLTIERGAFDSKRADLFWEKAYKEGRL